MIQAFQRALLPLWAIAAIGPTASIAAVDPAAELIKANARWIATINAGDYDAGLAAMPDDAAIIGAGGPIITGRQALTERVKQLTAAPGFHIDFSLISASLSDNKQVGYVIGDSVIKNSAPDGTQVVRKQRLLTVWRKGSDGRWLCYLDVVMGNAG